jgi:hypothetical protein
MEKLFSKWSVPSGYNQGNVRAYFSSVRENVKEGLEPGERGIFIVGAVTRKRLVTD